MNIEVDFTALGPEEVATLLLLLSINRNMENRIKREIESTGLFKCAVTEIGAGVDAIKRKLVSAVVGAALDNDLINKTPHHVHALIHATEEAVRGIFETNPLTGNVGLKISMVRDSQWIVVSVLGSCAAHHLSNHKHIGLGMMHIDY